MFGALSVYCFSLGAGARLSAWSALLAGAALLYAGIELNQSARQLREAEERYTERERETLAAAENEQKANDSLADGLNAAVLIVDSRAIIRYANRTAREFFRFENPLGRTVLSISLSYDLEQLVVETLHTGQRQEAEIAFAYPTDRVGKATAWPSADESDSAYLTIEEVTELRRLERVRQDFVSNVSHEIRTPLTIIRSMAETLLDEQPPNAELQFKYLPRIISEVDRLSLISNDLLILSAAESNPVRKQNCDLAEVFRTIVDQLASKASAKSLEVGYSGPESLIVQANPAQMSQVALNLVDNAINYTNVGSIQVSLSGDEDWATASVKDSGLGIASEHIPRIFERFYRVDKGRSRFSGGTGLGLSIVKHIVESHGGRVSVESELNQGSTFTLRLPIGDPE